jgi:hypothetical protein
MTNYLLAQVQLKYGVANRARFQAEMATVREVCESQNRMLVAGTLTSVGPNNEALNLWPIEDQGHLERVLDSVSPDDPKIRTAC